MSSNSESRDFSASRAVLIGVSDYDDPEFLPVPAARNSLDAVYEVLTDSDLCGWPEGRVTMIRNPSNAGRLAAQLRSIAADAHDIFMLYFVGHGTLTPRGELSLTLTDTVASDCDYTGLRYSWVREAFLDTPARTKVVILDCCAAGRALQALSVSNQILQSVAIDGVYTFAATEGSAPAHVVPLKHQASEMTSFTRELVRVIRSGVPLAPTWLTLEHIYTHVRHGLLGKNLPAPNRSLLGNVNNFRFTRNAASHAIHSEKGGNYLDLRRRELAEIITVNPSITLPSWPALGQEMDYNLSVEARDSSFICMDRYFVRTGTDGRSRFEICDLLGPQNELIYVKRALNSLPLSHLFNQAIVAVDLLVNVPEVRMAFSAAVREHGRNRLLSDDSFPWKVVFALAGEVGKVLTPESLFPFSQITLVQASRAIRSLGVVTEMIGIEIEAESPGT
ncbi:hypothetical protein FE391_18685 [Nonomuraea sp. KC401]|uniref:caspase, EACC1-associated type n=1 Tax=unclassified Nonomuraea TaxID=2593643 RepID=UPI0010FF4ECC|nr:MULTISPECIES: TIGR04141 family sporadically distributed protein [unclassified Nonomuraea]NBE95088.1 hypothetical protein [Nonomuraea sp. K271]TLF71705.1 hypothetical protein FE391_18685 [Nonomuraea sp. KC401]